MLGNLLGASRASNVDNNSPEKINNVFHEKVNNIFLKHD
jgi:hypothetical protein